MLSWEHPDPATCSKANDASQSERRCSVAIGHWSSGWGRQVTTEHNGYSVGAPSTLILPSSAPVGDPGGASSLTEKLTVVALTMCERSDESLRDRSSLHVEASGPVPALTYKIKHLLSYDPQWVQGFVLG